jgi:hypothetical protein
MAATVAIQVDPQTWDTLKQLSDQQHTSIGAIVREAVETYRRGQLIAQVREDLSRLRADPGEWNDFMAKFASMDEALPDEVEAFPWEQA